MGRRYLSPVFALCVVALCCEMTWAELTVCFANRTSENNSVQDQLTSQCTPFELSESSCALYMFDGSSNQSSVHYFCEENDSGIQATFTGSSETMRNYTCNGAMWCPNNGGDCLAANVPPPDCVLPPPQCRDVSQLAARVGASGTTQKFCNQLTVETENGFFASSNDSQVMMLMRYIQLLSEVVGLPDTNEEANCSIIIRELLCTWIFPDCSDEGLPQAPCPDYCMCVVGGPCSAAYANALGFLQSSDDAFIGVESSNPLRFLMSIAPSNCSDETLRFHSNVNYSQTCLSNTCVIPSGLTDEQLAAAIAVPVAGVLLVLVALCLCCCLCCRRRGDKFMENYPFAPSYNSRVGTLFGLPFHNQGSAIRSRSDLVKAVPETYMPLLSEHKDVLLQSSKIHTSVFLADGSHSEIYQGYIVENLHQAQTYRNVAIKRFKEHMNMTQILSYLEMTLHLNQVDHTNVMHLIGVGFDPSGSVLMVYPYYPDHDLLTFLKKKNAALSRDSATLEVTDLVHIATQIAEGMTALAQQGITYKMLSAHTCLVDSDLHVVVGDVCMVQLQEFNGVTQLPIFHRWMAPESITSEAFSEKSDVWAFGVTCWEIFSLGAMPHGAIEDDTLVSSHVTSENRLARPPLCPEAVYSIFLRCWKSNPETRPSFAELLYDLKSIKDSTQLDSQVGEIQEALRTKRLKPLASPAVNYSQLPPNAAIHHHSASPRSHLASPNIYQESQEMYMNISDGHVSDDRESIPSVYAHSAVKTRPKGSSTLPLQRSNTEKFEMSYGENKYETVDQGPRRLSLPAAYSDSSESSEYENTDLGPNVLRKKRTTKRTRRPTEREIQYYNLPRSYLELLNSKSGGAVTKAKKSKSSEDIGSKSLRPPPVAKKPENVKLKSSSDSTAKLISSQSASTTAV